jgi:hypothetical protein
MRVIGSRRGALLLALLGGAVGDIIVDAADTDTTKVESLSLPDDSSSGSLAERISRLWGSNEAKDGGAKTGVLPRIRKNNDNDNTNTNQLRRGLDDSDSSAAQTHPPGAHDEQQQETMPPYEMQVEADQPSIPGTLAAFVYQPKVTVVEGLPPHKGVSSLSNPCTFTKRKRDLLSNINSLVVSTSDTPPAVDSFLFWQLGRRGATARRPCGSRDTTGATSRPAASWTASGRSRTTRGWTNRIR